MGKKVHLINEVGHRIEVESCAIASEQTATSVMNEMARINTKEDGSSIFPYNAFNVHILSTDHKLPHFHILSNGWNISFILAMVNYTK